MKWFRRNWCYFLAAFGICLFILSEYSGRSTEVITGVIKDVQYIPDPIATVIRLSDGRVLNYRGWLRDLTVGKYTKLTVSHSRSSGSWWKSGEIIATSRNRNIIQEGDYGRIR